MEKLKEEKMSSLSQTMEEIVEFFENKGIPMRQHLRPGLSRAEIQSKLSPLGLVVPEGLYELYEWHDGMDDLYKPDLLLGEHQFIPLDTAIYEYHEMIKYFSEFTSLDLTKWLPFAAFHGSFFLVCCDPTPIEGLENPIIRIFEGIYIEFENLDRMPQTVLEWFKAGVYGSDEPVPDEIKLIKEIRERINPRIPDGNSYFF